MTTRITIATTATVVIATAATIYAQPNYTIVDTGQDQFYNNTAQLQNPPQPGQPFHGQDAQHIGNQPSYRDQHDGTVLDLNTNLIWQKSPDFKNLRTWAEAQDYADTLNLAGHSDWRVPTIKELYSLIDFRGSSFDRIPYIDTHAFDFEYPDPDSGLRDMDSQFWTSTVYVGTTMNNDPTAFGVNFADGRIKGYPKDIGPNGEPFARFVRCVRGRTDYGQNQFVDNNDGTITARATNLQWLKNDSGSTKNWQQALAYAENLDASGHDDWRLPNAKELQSIIDYNRAPDATDPAKRGPAIDPIFNLTDNESYFWSSTTHLDGPSPDVAVYLCVGQAWGYMGNPGNGQWMNVHGAGAQRSDPKAGNPADYPYGRGPQGDDIRIYNYVRLVRSVGPALEVQPNPLRAGGQALCSVSHAKPNAKTFLAYTTKGIGGTFIPDLHISIDLRQPKQAGHVKQTDSQGQTSWLIPIPPNTAGLDVALQAVQFDGKTNVIFTKVVQ